MSIQHDQLLDIWKPGEQSGEGGGADTESNEEKVAKGERFIQRAIIFKRTRLKFIQRGFHFGAQR